MKEYLPGCWISIIKVGSTHKHQALPLTTPPLVFFVSFQIKDAHYKALAHYYAAVAHETLAATYSEL